MTTTNRSTWILPLFQLLTIAIVFWLVKGPLTELRDTYELRSSNSIYKQDLVNIIKHLENMEKTLSDKINSVEKTLSDKINSVEKTLSDRINSVEKTLSDRINSGLSSTKETSICPEEKYRQEKESLRQMVLKKSTRVDDPDLLRYLRTYVIDQPSKRMSKYSNKLHFYPQTEAVNKFFDGAEGGFYVECGGLDGERSSNTLWLETNKKWKGVLIEMDPSWYEQLRGKNRKAWSLNACLSLTNYPVEMSFFESDRGSGALTKERENNKPGSAATADCFPVYSILLALNRTRVDYFSLDVEGKELDVLKTIPFDKIDIKVLTVEFLHVPGGEAALIDFMKTKGYYKHSKIVAINRLIAMYTYDLVFVKEGLPTPIPIST